MDDPKTATSESVPVIPDSEGEEHVDPNTSPAELDSCATLPFTKQRSSSPGVAKRVITQTKPAPDHLEPLNTTTKATTDNTIDNITQKLADSLLDDPSKHTPAPSYVSINQQIEDKRQKELETHLAQNEVTPVRQSTDIPSVHTSSSYNQLNSAVNGNTHDAALMSDVTHNLLESNSLTGVPNAAMEASTLNIDKSVHNTNGPPSTQTLWENSNGTGGLIESEPHASTEEVDILTAMSGKPTPSSLPLVTDGLSDGEVSSDSDVNDEVEVLNAYKQINRRDQVNNHQDDPFFAQHKSIMKSQTAEQMEAVNATLVEIQSAMSGCKQRNSSVPELAKTTADGLPIWEIRESYAETLRQQEEKRKQRMESERRYEQEYRDRQLLEIEQLEADDNRIMPPQTLDDDSIEQLNTDYYSSDEDDVMDGDGGKGWGWGANKKYSRVGNVEGTERPTALSQPNHMHASNASRLADHHILTSPRTARAKRNKRLSNSSYSSSSQSSMAPSTVVRCKAHDLPSTESNTDSSSSNSWDYGDSESPVHLLPAHSRKKREQGDYDTDEETDRLLNKPYQGEGKVELPADTQELGNQAMKNKAKEGKIPAVTVYDPDEPTVLIEGILFRAAYLGSTQLISEAQPSKAIRMMQAQEAVGRIKAPDGENQPSTDVDLFVSTEKVMVLNTDLQEIMMDHALRSISYIADIDHILVIMAKRSLVMSSSTDEESSTLPTITQQKLICHIFETDEAHLIAQSIGQAFQVAYMEFLKANGIDDPNLHMKDTSYEDILEQQEIMNDELETFTRKDKQKDIIVPKSKGESLGIVIVESGWGSVLPTVVLANMSPVGAAARCSLLNIGDQIMSVNGMSLVGLPLSTCQEHVKAVKNLTAVRLCVVSRPPVVEVLIKRPDKKYQLGFSVQNGVICSLLRGGIAERGGVRVGHRIIEINSQSVVAVAHEKIVHMLSTSVGEIHMKTMPMAVFRLLTGQEVPQYI